MLYQWEPDNKGILQLCHMDKERHPITLSNLHPHAGTRYLGLYLMMDQNTKPMETHLWDKALLYTQAFQHMPMNHHKAGVLYKSCFLPALTYPLPATWLLDQFFEKIHQLSTSTILNKWATTEPSQEHWYLHPAQWEEWDSSTSNMKWRRNKY